jgi:PAS domain S-box-containing protein/putative nucleotidyltransferase with HDIG domain
MNAPFQNDPDRERMRSQIIGLNDRTLRKSYFPQLQRQIEELKQARETEREKAAALERSLEELRRSRAETEASERKFRLLADFTNDIEYWVSTEGKIIYLSPSCEKITGYTQQEFAADSSLLEKIVYPEDRALVATHASSSPGMQPHSADVRIVTRQGEVRWLSHTCQPVYSESGEWLGRRGSNRDITQRKLAEEKVQRLSNMYAALSQSNEAIVRCSSAEELLPRICRNAVERGGATVAWVGLLDRESKRLRCAASFGDATGFLDAYDVDLSALHPLNPLAVAMLEQKAVWNTELDANFCEAEFLAWSREAKISQSASLPLVCNGQIAGCFELYTCEFNRFDDDVSKLWQEMAIDISFALSNFAMQAERDDALARAHTYLEKIENSFMHTLMMAMNLSELRDPYTAGHERRVGLLARAIAEEMKLDSNEAKGLEVAGYLHDLGKITIPIELLVRPGKLSATEQTLIQGHVLAGYNVLHQVEFPWPVASIVLEHHERLDGSGYPNHLQGEQISLAGRILAVADVVEAMASHRPYRPSRGVECALAEVEQGSGLLFDREVVAACLRLFREKKNQPDFLHELVGA